jgi:hypothetical protein
MEGLARQPVTFPNAARFTQVSEASRAKPMAQFKPVAPGLQVNSANGGEASCVIGDQLRRRGPPWRGQLPFPGSS